MRIGRRSAVFLGLVLATFATVAHGAGTEEAVLFEPSSPAEGFLENRGQIDPAVLFYATGERGAVYFTSTGLVLEVATVETSGKGIACHRNMLLKVTTRMPTEVSWSRMIPSSGQ